MEDTTKKDKKEKTPSKFTTPILSAILIVLIVICAIVFVKYAKSQRKFYTAYVCTITENKIIAFSDSDDGFVTLHIDKSSIKGDIPQYGDKIYYYGKNNSSNDKQEQYLKNIEIVKIDQKTNNYWPMTSYITKSYSKNFAIENHNIIMENESIVSGQDTIEQFENAINNKTPYYVRIVDYYNNTSTIITDVFYDGQTFKVAEDSTLNDENIKGERLISYSQYSLFEKYKVNDIEFTYLTNTANILSDAISSGTIELFAEQDSAITEPLDIFWLYYDLSNYVGHKENIEETEIVENTLTFENDLIPCPKLLVSYTHYFNEEIIISNDGSSTKTNDTSITSNTQNNENTSISNVKLKKTTDEIEARDIYIEQDGKVYNQKGIPTLEKDVGGYLIITDESDTIDIQVEDGYTFDDGLIKIYSYSDLENKEATPLQEIELSPDTPITLELPEEGLYIYEITLNHSSYNARYVFFLKKQS